jgi:hypothetical protein
MYNNSTTTLTVHDLEDSQLGILLEGEDYELLPGSSFSITETVNIGETTFNLAAWTAYDDVGNTYQSYDYASVVFQEKYFMLVLPVNYKGY